MKNKISFIVRLSTLLVLFLTLSVSTAAAESYDADTMRLLRYEGDVVIEDNSGEPRFVMENMRFSSGEAMRTGEGAIASVNLDNTQIVTMDENSRVQFFKENDHMRMNLTDGTLFLDVQQKLDQNETLDIETSTMTVGIRGTIIALSDFPVKDEKPASLTVPQPVSDEASEPGSVSGADKNKADKAIETDTLPSESAAREATAPSTDGLDEILNTDVVGTNHGRVSVLCVLEGVATVTYRDTGGDLHTIQVHAGEKAVLTDRLGDGQADKTVNTEKLYREDLEDFVIKQAENDPTVKARVENASDVLTNSNPLYQTQIMLTAGSAEKSFDGAGFSDSDLAVTAEGLPEGYTCSATVSGSQVDVGSGENVILKYAIYDNHGLDVTNRFTNLTTENGILSVTWDKPVTLIAQSASRIFNGEPLRRTSDVLVYGLPAEYSIRVFADGSQTDVGTSPNPVSSYTIYNSEGKDITKYFTNIQKVSGQLVVDPAPLTVWTGSAEKTYDGTPLTNSHALVISAPGYEYGSPSWRNLSYVFSEISSDTDAETDCQILYGICGIVRVHGTNPLTGEIREIELHAGQKLLVYLHDKENVQSIEFKLADVFEAELPEEILRLFSDNPDLMKQSCADAAWDPEILAKLINALPEQTGNEPMVEQAGLRVAESKAQHLMTDFTNVRITIDTKITDYNNRALGREEAHYTPVYIDETIKVKATGSQTEIGQSTNTYTISWGSANPKNYTLIEDLGTLTVTRPAEAGTKITLTAASAEKTYDGTPLEADSVSVKGLPKGYSIVASASGSQKDAGSSSNKVAEYKILNESGTDVTSGFKNIITVDGILTVNPAKAAVTTGSSEKVYDGEALTCDEAGIEGLVNGETAVVKATGSVTEPGEAENRCEIDWGDTKPDNYILEKDLGTLKVEKLELALTLGNINVDYTGHPAIPDASITYMNGTHAGETVSGLRLTSMSICPPAPYLMNKTVPGMLLQSANLLFHFQLFTEDGINLSITGMEAAVGTYNLKTGVTFTEGAEGRYNISSISGTTMTVKPAVLTIVTGSESKPYDGEALVCPDVSVTGFVNGETATVTATGTITDAGTAENTYTIDWGTINRNNYKIGSSGVMVGEKYHQPQCLC